MAFPLSQKAGQRPPASVGTAGREATTRRIQLRNDVQWHLNKYHQLASRLTSAADGIVNSAAINLERDLREAAEVIQKLGEPSLPAVPKLVSELAKIANTTSDVDTQRRLRRLLGEAA